MDQNDIIKYFNEYIKNYSPYANSTIFSSLIEYLENNYLPKLYNDIPYNFKQLWEENKIPNELYNILLQNIGVPKKILNELSQIDKISFFNNFNNFNQYRGNLDFFNKISKLNSFNTFNVYELYIDYYVNDWVFKPKIIINNIDFIDNVYLDYNSIYNNVPNFLINKSQLNYYKNNNEIVLPFKSNLLLLKYLYLYKEIGISNLIFSTFLKEYQINTFILYFKDTQFNVSLKTFTIIWFYLFLKLYDTTSFVEISNIFTCLLYLNSNNEYNIYDLETIINEYNLISNTEELYTFYNEYLIDYFLKSTTFSGYDEDDLLNYIDVNIIDYLNTRISSSDNINTYNIIFNELLNSFDIYLNSSIDENFKKYSEYFLNSLTKLITDPKKTGSFKLLNHYKPFHVELITDYNTYIISDNKFNINIPTVRYNFRCNYNSIDNFNILEYINNTININNITNINEINEINIFNFLKTLDEENIIDDESKYKLLYTFQDDNILLEYINNNITINNINNIFNINEINVFDFFKTLDDENIIDDESTKILNKKEIEYKLLIDYANIIHLLPNIQYVEHLPDELELYCNYSNYEIYYTIDGSDPTIEDILYTSHITVNGNTIKAIAYNNLDDSYSEIFEY
jgi:hypothetical protein